MAKQKITGLTASLLEPPAASGEEPGQGAGKPAKPVVQTVKVPPEVFVRLKTVGALERRSSQDIILTALQEYLSRFS